MLLNRTEIIRILGEVDDVTIAHIASSGSTAEELAEARAWVANDEPLLNIGKPGRVGQLAELLRKLEEERAEPEPIMSP